MPALAKKLLKHSFLAQGVKPRLLWCYLLYSLSSHLLLPVLPHFWRAVFQGVWVLFTFFVFFFVIIHSLGETELLSLPYQQIPVKPAFLVATQVLLIFNNMFFFLAARFFFALDTPLLLPDGFTLAAAANILSFGLYATAISIGIVMLPLSLSTKKEPFAALIFYAAIGLIFYLLLFHIAPDPLDVARLLSTPLFDLPEGSAAAGSWLQAPWSAAWRNIFHLTIVLFLQIISLTWLLSGKIDTR